MRTMTGSAAAAALLLASAQPCFAADDLRGIDSRPEHRSSAFAGARFRVPFGGPAERQKPTARLQLGVDHIHRDTRSAAPARTYSTSGLELGVTRHGAPSLSVAGTPARQLERRLGISTGGAIAIGVGVTLVALLAVVAASEPPEWPD